MAAKAAGTAETLSKRVKLILVLVLVPALALPPPVPLQLLAELPALLGHSPLLLAPLEHAAVLLVPVPAPLLYLPRPP